MPISEKQINAVKVFAYNRGLDSLINNNYSSYQEYFNEVDNNYDILDLWVFSKDYRNICFDGYRDAWERWIDYKENNKGIPFYKELNPPWKIVV